MSKIWLTQSISSDSLFPNITRKVNILNANLQAQYEQIVIDAFISYFDENESDVTNKFKSNVDNWIINNTTLTTVLNQETGEPVPNPDYVDEETTPEVYPFQRLPSFNYFFDLITVQRVDLIQLMQQYIDYNDSHGDFNF